MSFTQQEEQKLKIASPEKVARLLEKAGETGLPLLIRTLSHPGIAVKGRAKSSGGPVSSQGFQVGNLSERGLEHLAKNSDGGVQVEFSLSSVKVMFYSSVAHFTFDECTLTIPDYLLSVERRKNSRFQVVGVHRAYVSLPGWHPNPKDAGVPPYFDSAIDLAELLPVGDVSLGGLSIVEKFPAACSQLAGGTETRPILIHLPMAQPIEVEASVRWNRKTRDVVTEVEGQSRIISMYRFGIQFVNPGSELLMSLKGFIQMIAQAEAI